MDDTGDKVPKILKVLKILEGHGVNRMMRKISGA